MGVTTPAETMAMRCDSATRRGPDVVEVEPLVGLIRHRPFERGDQASETSLFASPLHPDGLLQEDPVGAVCPEHTEGGEDRRPGGPGQLERTDGEWGRCAEERQEGIAVATGRAIALDGDNLIPPQRRQEGQG